MSKRRRFNLFRNSTVDTEQHILDKEKETKDDDNHAKSVTKATTDIVEDKGVSSPPIAETTTKLPFFKSLFTRKNLRRRKPAIVIDSAQQERPNFSLKELAGKRKRRPFLPRNPQRVRPFALKDTKNAKEILGISDQEQIDPKMSPSITENPIEVPKDASKVLVDPTEIPNNVVDSTEIPNVNVDSTDTPNAQKDTPKELPKLPNVPLVPTQFPDEDEPTVISTSISTSETISFIKP